VCVCVCARACVCNKRRNKKRGGEARVKKKDKTKGLVSRRLHGQVSWITLPRAFTRTRWLKRLVPNGERTPSLSLHPPGEREETLLFSPPWGEEREGKIKKGLISGSETEGMGGCVCGGCIRHDGAV
jgi:hypothetical protein